MKKNLIVVASSLFLFLASCGGNANSSSSDSCNVDTLVQEDLEMPIYVGEYVGVIPAADADGLNRSLTLKPDNTYSIKDSAYWRGEPVIDLDNGSFEVNSDTLTLKSSDKEFNKVYQFLISGDSLVQLNDEKKPTYPAATLRKK